MPFQSNPAAYGTMLRTNTHKICIDHSHNTGELYDLTADPGEKNNLWDQYDHLQVKCDLLTKLNHAQCATVDPLPPRIAPWQHGSFAIRCLLD